MRWLRKGCGKWLVIAIMAAASTTKAATLASIYPPEEHCVFVPPPVWKQILVLDERQACHLSSDRALAIDAIEQLRADRQWIIQSLTPDQGLTPSMLDEMGPPLQRNVRRSFENFIALWRSMRIEDQEKRNRLVGRFREACERGALLTLWKDADGRTHAGVLSLITGNLLVNQLLELPEEQGTQSC